MRDLNDITLEEFQALENFGQSEIFNDVIIVPTAEIHDSGYRCMKFVLVRRGVIVGCVGGYSDVVHPNGISNMGLHPDFNMYKQGFIPAMRMSIDCLRESGCVRLMFGKCLKCDDFIVSDFLFYLAEDKV